MQASVEVFGSVEPFSGVIRLGPEHRRLGDPYLWHVDWRAHPEHIGVVVIGPATGEAIRHRVVILTCLAGLRDNGGYCFDQAFWVRRRANGRKQARAFDLRRYR